MDVDKLKKGSEHIKQRSGGGGKYTPVIFWGKTGPDAVKHLAFITPIEEMYTLDYHTVKTKNGWRSFVCRKNEAFLDESNGDCVLCDTYNNKPGLRHFALAAELEAVEEKVGGRKVITDLRVKMVEKENKEGKTVAYPRIGVVVQAASNFYDYLKAYDAQRADITTISFEVQRSGVGSTTSYQFFPSDIRPDLSEFESDYPSLIDYIAEQGSVERYAAEVEGVEVEEQKKGGSRPASTSTTSTPPAATSDVETVPADSPEGEDSFEALRARLEASGK